MKFSLLFALLLFQSQTILASDDNIDAAIQQAQLDLQSPQARASAGPQAKEAQKKVKELTPDAATEQDVYALAADVFGNMKGKSLEDMAKLLENAQKNPESFASSWTPEQRKRLQEISARLPAGHGLKP